MREPVEVVRRVYEAFSYGDWKTARGFVDLNVTWSLLRDRPEVLAYAERVGPTGLMSYWATIFRQYRVRPREYIPRGDNVIVPIDLYGRGGRGVSHRHEVWSVCVREGKIRTVDEFADVETALEAAVDSSRAS
jgi:ketosteroid isomerase-like protein